ncbi:hypothetical protein GO986_17180 [Deinococcus sp. HMF7620]|uniref:Uncharacterized protein n=1 Tax=Deinococcus arboris TaxID=2682977 RepID=A0A7C9LP04_9DEIO|nr:hypothetical protein [Deinococcus arboris]MVN88477.1 hypothetical protein [Deinococcus arboris]
MFVVLRGGCGARSSKYALLAYHTGVQVFLAWALEAGVRLSPNGSFRYVRFLEGQQLVPRSMRARLSAARSLLSDLPITAREKR